jgi:hypothetical protein
VVVAVMEEKAVLAVAAAFVAQPMVAVARAPAPAKDVD